jgi:CheY-like chemotaxis protein
LLGGSVSVSSEPGKGSVFSVTLPLSVREGTVTAKLDVIGHMGEPVETAEAFAEPQHQEAPVQSHAPAHLTVQAASNISEPSSWRASVASHHVPQPIADDRANRKRPDRVILAIEDDLRFAQILHDLAHELEFDFVHATTATHGVELARELQPNGILLDVGLPDQSGLTVLEWLKHDPLTRHIPIHVVSSTDHADIALHLGAIGYTLKPSARDTLAGAIRKLEARSAQGTRRVLVVEDDPALRQSIHALLQSTTVEIVEAGTIAEAMDEINRGTFDCIVMDLALPDGSGYDLLERVSTSQEHASPPVIVYTGRVLSPDEEQRLRRYSKSIIIKGAKSPERLVDEVTLFLHSVESALPPEQQRMLRAARQRDDVFEGRTILLAEDDVRNIFALSHVIEPLGAKLEIARNGREALDALARHPDIDLVLMDIMMPEMDGFTAMTEIRKDPEHARLPIIALTAKAMASDRQKCLEAGADDYISKPIDVDKLVSLCRVWLRQR